MNSNLPDKINNLWDSIAKFDFVIVAFSGGVDSSVLAKLVFDRKGPQGCVAVTAVSPSLAERDLQNAKDVAIQIGIDHELIDTNEFANDKYLRNDGNRCFFCKDELYSQIDRRYDGQVVNGANVDDWDDHRPGLLAAKKHGVKSPLADSGFNKQEIRQVAKQFDLPVWERPASPCLSSRIAYQEEVDPEKLSMVESAESWLINRGYSNVRVRFHSGKHARIELPIDDLHKLLHDHRAELVDYFREIGFEFVSLDLEGFQSGRLNRSLEEQPGNLIQIGHESR